MCRRAGATLSSPSPAPNLELRSVNKLAPLSQLPLGALLTSRSSPPLLWQELRTSRPFVPLSRLLTHTLCRWIQIPPPPGWLGRDLINPQTAKEGTESWDGGQDGRAGGELKEPSSPSHPSALSPLVPGSSRQLRFAKGSYLECCGGERRRPLWFTSPGVGALLRRRSLGLNRLPPYPAGP